MGEKGKFGPGRKKGPIDLAKYLSVFDSFPLGITVADETGRIVKSNREASRILGLDSDEHEARNIDGSEWSIVRADGSPMPPEEYASVRALSEGRQIDNVEMGVKRGNGETVWIYTGPLQVSAEEDEQRA